MVTRRNYELYVIDYLEGKLNASDRAMFMAFLEKNRDIEAEISLIKNNSRLIPNEHASPDFSSLRKNLNSIQINEKNFEEMCIAYHEGDLDSQAQKRLFNFIENDIRKKQKLELYGRLKLLPDESVVFKNKSSLIRQKVAIYPYKKVALITTLAAAASVTLFLLFQKPVQDLHLGDSAQTSLNHINKNKSVASNSVDEKSIAQNKQIPEPVIKNKIFHKKAETKLLAAVDTTTTTDDDFIRISMIDACSIKSDPIQPEINLQAHNTDVNSKKKESITIEFIKDKGLSLFARASSLTLNEVISNSVKGINNMVETDIKYIAQTDNNGQITEMELSVNNFNFSRKLTRN